MRFVAIDFETANETRCSACALGIAVVEGGQVVERTVWLIRPPEMRFSPFNISIHGIHPSDVEGQPTFCEIWPALLPYFSRRHLVAHNAVFDISVLRRTLDTYGLEYPDCEYACTRQLAKCAWPGLPTYNLKSLAGHLGITLRHHDAADDANACAQIALQAYPRIGASTLGNFLKRLTGPSQNSESQSYQRPRSQPVSKSIKLSDIQPSSSDFHPREPFVGHTFVFTGALVSMDRKVAMQKVVDAGGRCSHSVTRSTNYLVIGGLYTEDFADGYQTGKLKSAVSLIAAGVDLEIITEDDFLKLLSD